MPRERDFSLRRTTRGPVARPRFDARAIAAGCALALVACAAPLPAPVERLAVSPRPDLIARGRHLVHGPAHCVACHGAPEAGQAPGDEPALSGGRRIELGLAGSVTAPNITPEPDTGIGRMTDVEIARALRHGIGRDGRALVPVMSTAGLSDHDIGAVVAYLRTLEPVRAPHASREGLSLAGRTAMALGLQPPATTPYRPPVHVIADRSAAHGEYLARAVAACQTCHTARHPLTGRPEGLPFGGGSVLQHAGREWVPPSLRGQASVLAGRSEPDFIDLFRRRQAVASSSPMPWREFGRMDDTELAALYRYLSSLSDPLASPQTSR